jgi:hypothetical protein
MTRHILKAITLALLAMTVPMTAAHASTITDDFTITGSNFFLTSGAPDVVPGNFTATFTLTFDPTATIAPTNSGFTLTSASAGFDPSYYGYSYASGALTVAGLSSGSLSGNPNHFDFLLAPDLNTVAELRYITNIGSQFNAGTASVSVAEASATPLPASLPMFGAALLAFGAFAWRKRQNGLA